MELDEEQMVAVDSKESQVVVAGPGSGKTRVLTEKARALFEKGEDILCLTFTRSAAREMQSRVPGLPASTIHSYCCGGVGWDEAWGYEGLLYRFLNTTDKRRFSWVLLDEAQDVNALELDVVLSLVGDKLFAVGDPYQSIYGFQGAMGPKVITFLESMGCRKIDLRNNYRSSPEIVSRLNRWFNRGLISKNIKQTGLTYMLFRKNEDLFFVSSFLKKRGVPHGVRLSAEYGANREYNVIGLSSTKLMTIHCSKGHEADRVLLFDWYPDGEPEEMRVMYVAMARASQEFKEVRTLEGLIKLL